MTHGTTGGGSPHARDVAQRERIDNAFGAPTQRVDDEDELQRKAGGPIQLQEDDEELLQGRFGTVQRQGNDEEEPLQAQSEARSGPGATPAVSPGGLPAGLRQGIEALSGMDLSDVRVHTGSSKPAEIQALAYAQGNEIHVAPGQEQHLPHEAWHVVQQRQGRVRPTIEVNRTAVNDDAALEAEADRMGALADRLHARGDGSQRPCAELQAVDSADLRGLPSRQHGQVVTQRSYASVESKAKGNLEISQQELEEGIRDLLLRLVDQQGYKDATGRAVAREQVAAVNFIWDADYGAAEGIVLLPSMSSVIADIRQGAFSLALEHEMAHYIRRGDTQMVGAFGDVEAVVDAVDWEAAMKEHPEGKVELWKEEVRADMKAVKLGYAMNGRYPTSSELDAFQAMLGATVDASHPPAKFRRRCMEIFIQKASLKR